MKYLIVILLLTPSFLGAQYLEERIKINAGLEYDGQVLQELGAFYGFATDNNALNFGIKAIYRSRLQRDIKCINNCSVERYVTNAVLTDHYRVRGELGDNFHGDIRLEGVLKGVVRSNSDMLATFGIGVSIPNENEFGFIKSLEFNLQGGGYISKQDEFGAPNAFVTLFTVFNL